MTDSENAPMKRPDYWFPAKTFGWGWGLPITWQGWVVLLCYCFSLIAANEFFSNGAKHLAIALPTVALLLICWRKGETPAWRWGSK